MSAFDVIVAGNGAIGHAILFSLYRSSPGLRLALAGDPARTHGASIAAGAMLGGFGEVTAQLRASAPGRIKTALAIEAAALWPEWLRALERRSGRGIEAGSGTFVADTGGAIEGENYDAIEAELREAGEPFEAGAAPPVSPELPLRRAMFLPREGWLDPAGLLEAYEAAASLQGVVRIDQPVRALLVRDDRLEGVELESGERVLAKVVVLATGARTQVLLERLPELSRRIPPLSSGVGAALTVSRGKPLEHVVRTPNRALAGGLHLVPRGDGRTYVGATNILRAGPEVPGTAEAGALIAAADRELDRGLAGAPILARHHGSRPVSADGFPLFGRTSLEGLWIATGTHRDGLHLSPVLGTRLVAELLGQRPATLPHLAPERRPLQTASRAEAISAAARASAVEPSVVEALYARLDPELSPPPELFPLLARDREAEARVRAYYQRRT